MHDDGSENFPECLAFQHPHHACPNEHDAEQGPLQFLAIGGQRSAHAAERGLQTTLKTVELASDLVDEACVCRTDGHRLTTARLSEGARRVSQ